MTYTSFSLKVLKNAAMPRVPDFGTIPEPFVASLRFPSAGSQLGFLKKWAEERRIDIHYVDNCWIEVTVSANQLGEFLRERYRDYGAYVCELTAQISDANDYVIVAEEF